MIFWNCRGKHNLDGKLLTPSSQLGSHTPDMVPECDVHWLNSPSSNAQHQGSVPPEFMPNAAGYASRKRSTNEPPPQTPFDEAQLVQIATEAFVRELGLQDDSVLRDGKVQIREVPAGTYLMKEESHKVL